MSLEQRINHQLNKFPWIKKGVKSVYQHVMYAISPKIKSEGNITRISPNDDKYEYFFGYYDKSPWDITDRCMLCMRANNTWSDVSPKEKADILLIDTFKHENDSDRVKKIAETGAWNVQQACMLQWLGPDYSSKILYNDYRNGKYCSVIKTLATGEERVIDTAVYTVSSDGKFALTLDFSRLYNLRPGYGYYNVKEVTEGVALPDSTAVWTIDLESGEVKPLLKYTDFASFQPRSEMLEKGSVHKVNHLMLSPSGKRFMVLYRWFNGQRKYTRLVTCNVDGTDMYVLSDDDMVSHCFWKDNEHILAFENKKDGGPGYYLMQDKTQEYVHCWPQFSNDGHPSYSPDRSLIVTDSYPNRARVASLNLMDGDESKKENKTIAKVFAPFKYDNDTRCDLHPRWNHAGDKICFDSAFEGHRGVYVVDISEYKEPIINDVVEKSVNETPKYSIITPMYNSFNLMGRYFDSLNRQIYKNFEVIIVDDCSTDDSYEKLRSYAEKSPLTISVYRSEKNMGPGNARNIGIAAAAGDWLIFIDSDDYVDTKLFSAIDKWCESLYDVVLFDYCKVIKNKKVPKYTVQYHEGGLVEREHAALWVTTNVCGKVYKKSFIQTHKILFPDIHRFEDWVFIEKAIYAAKSIFYIRLPLYFYADNEKSIVHLKNVGVFKYSYNAISLLSSSLDNYSADINEAIFIREYLYVALKEQLINYDINIIHNVMNTVESRFPDWKENKYISQFSRSQRIILKIAEKRKFYLLRMLGRLL